MLRRLAATPPQQQDAIIGWFPEELEQAAAAFALAVAQGAIVRISGNDDADITARWMASPDVVRGAMAEASAKSN